MDRHFPVLDYALWPAGYPHSGNTLLTLSQAANFRLFQTEFVDDNFKFDKMAGSSPNG